MKEAFLRNNGRTLYLSVGIGGILVSASLRVMSSFGDLWLDEIWSLYHLKNVKYLWDILMIRHDNNHILNSMWMVIAGNTASGFWYRLPSIVAGTAAIALMGLINLRFGLLAGGITSLLGGLSYPLIHYSSEARGYAPAMLFSLTAFFFLREALVKNNLKGIVLFWASVLFGLLSHLTFLYIYVSLAVWSLVRLFHSSKGIRSMAVRLARLHALPTAALAALYLFYIHTMAVGGGDPQGFKEALTSLATLVAGAPEFSPAAGVGVLLFCVGLLGGLLHLHRQGSDEWVFFLFALIIAPVGSYLATRPGFLYERYFLLSIPFYYLMTGQLLAAMFTRSRFWTSTSCAVLAFFLWGNLQRTADLINTGRGQYHEAVSYLAEHTRGPDILVGSDHDFRNRMVLLYYSQYLPKGKRLLYFNQNQWPTGGPEWLFTHSQEADFVPQKEIVLATGGTFTLEKHYSYKGLSGWHWALYRNNAHAKG